MSIRKAPGTVFDIEANGIVPDKIHCLSVGAKDKIRTTFSYKDMSNFFSKKDSVLVGHNIIRYDIPVVERLLNLKSEAKVVDTLSLSWYLYPDKIIHGLDAWGTDLGVAKPKVDDWENLTKEEYAHRCEEDVKINTLLWEKQWKKLLRMYGSEEKAWRLIDYLSFKMKCAAEQEKNRWKIDVPRCKEGIEELDGLIAEKVAQLKKVMPAVPVYKTKTKPKKMFKQDGSLSSLGERWVDLCKENDVCSDNTKELVVLHGYNEPNPASTPQLKSWLSGLGWKPKTFKYKRNKVGPGFERIPQINNGADGICSSIKTLYDKEPSLELLDGLSVLNHRVSILKGFIDNLDEEGYIQARIQGITNTLRFKHSVAVNLPGVAKPFGSLIRGCLIAPDGYELCGSDMSSLEDRTKHHYMWDYDPEYVKEMNTDDFDPHLDLAVSANMMSSAEVLKFKGGDKEIKEKFSSVRHDAKQVNYSCLYGVSPGGIVRNTGMALDKAEELHKTYWKRNWSVEEISKNCKVITIEGGKWLFNPVSELYYSLRHDKDRFSTLNQGTGVWCFDNWLRFVSEGGPPVIGQFHDEGIWLIRKGKRDKCFKHLKEAMKKTNEFLGLNRELDCDIQFGDNYAEIH